MKGVQIVILLAAISLSLTYYCNDGALVPKNYKECLDVERHEDKKNEVCCKFIIFYL